MSLELTQKAQVIAAEETLAVNTEILPLRCQLRQGGPLRAGDFLQAGRFELLERLGQGGFASLWKAYDEQRHTRVVLKVLHGQYADDRTRRERFFRGAQRMAALHHSGIVQVLDKKLKDEGYHFFVMEYLEGGDFHAAVLGNRLPRQECLAVIQAVGEALQVAHAQGVVHRNVKPANIVLDHQGRAKLTDFDWVRALDTTTGGTLTGSSLGTVVYAAPELLFRAQSAGVPADVYGLAMTAVFALYGTDLPFEALGNALGFIEGLETSQAVKRVLQKAVARDEQARYASVEQFCQALGRPPEVLALALQDALEQEPRERRLETSVPGLQDTQAYGAVKQAPRYGPYQSFRDLLKEGTRAPDMVYLPAGTFKMGDTQGKGWDWERPVHEVSLSAFAIGRYPVTVGEYLRFVQATQSHYPEWLEVGSPYHIETGQEDYYRGVGMSLENTRHPVVGVSWEDARVYCEWLSEQTGEAYALLTEAEWEYACRAGSGTAYCCGDDEQRFGEYAWYTQNAAGKIHPVGRKRANAWGLYDMHGNVWEWVQDWFGDYSSEPQSHPRGPESSSGRVIRGGGWDDSAGYCRSAYRNRDAPDLRHPVLGFRLRRRV